MHISILTFDGFNELDSLIALGILNRIKQPDWRVTLASPTPEVTSMNGVTLQRHITLREACQADAVLIGSGMKTREVVADHRIIEQLQFDPSRQLIGAQCSGVLILEKLGLLHNIPACTDLTTSPWLQDNGIEILNQAFFANENIASSGGCLASQYRAAWVIARLVGIEAAKEAIHYVAPVGEKERYVQQTLDNLCSFLPTPKKSIGV